MEISGNSLSVLSQMMSTAKVAQEHQTAVLKLANDQIKQNGANALQLVQSVPQPAADGNLGRNIDVMA